jgi:ribosomal protein L30/L7E
MVKCNECYHQQRQFDSPFRMKGNVLSSSTSGYAYVGGACVKNVRLRKISSVAIVEDKGGYSGVIVAAHELGRASRMFYLALLLTLSDLPSRQ